MLFLFQLFIWQAFLDGCSCLIGQTWWSSVAQLSAHHDFQLSDSRTKPFCSQLPGLSSGQARICELFTDHMAAVSQGALQAIKECQNQFRNRRWNCSTPYGSDIFGPVHILGTREASFTYAITSAGVAHEVARQCRFGVISSCGCSESRRPKKLRKDWEWGGCGDNYEYGYEFAKNFIDVREKEYEHSKEHSRYGRSLMNRWNNAVGRKVIKRNTKVSCKCHGVSGSCNLKTCWKQMPDMKETGKFLIEKYDEAIRVKLNHRGNLQLLGGKRKKYRKRKRKSARQLDLVYLHESPDYCRRDLDVGTLGTSGRFCNKTSQGIIYKLCDTFSQARGSVRGRRPRICQ